MTATFFFASDIAQFEHVADDVFDQSLSTDSLQAFLDDDRHHIVLAKDGDLIVGFVSAVDYVHPDKPRELWINEVGVAADWCRQGIAKRLMSMMLDHGRDLGCTEAWVLTEPENEAANALYQSSASSSDPEPSTVVLHGFNLV